MIKNRLIGLHFEPGLVVNQGMSAQTRSKTVSSSLTTDRLVAVEATLDLAARIKSDPVQFPLRYQNKLDQEVAGLIASSFAYGNVKLIVNTVSQILEFIGPRPSETLKNLDPNFWKSRIPRGFKHRFNSAGDLSLFLYWIGLALKNHGSLETLLTDDGAESLKFDVRLNLFIDRLTAHTPSSLLKHKKSAMFLLPKPSDGSACKRLMLFLRWMVSSGPMNLGIWRSIDPRDLVIPVDTHILRISQNLGFTERKVADWKTALEITDHLKRLTPEDPTRFDFALCHIGISQACPSRYSSKVCVSCRINDLCLKYRRSETKQLTRIAELR